MLVVFEIAAIVKRSLQNISSSDRLNTAMQFID
ncbi:hypothetical protein swp_1742 [Shewanella piezotolerans WP3]|uniref:Uncharacterized protein n=1 Tax=Shewanella piezotolerans (strain WP3 / JCM 13877) TaxID=225849 RepID=B8CN10_SHEPW|nr:hypothetical protein swp_1742 [Shewanella piezotolerans WP3]